MIKIVQAQSSHLNEVAQLFDAYRVFYRKDTDLPAAKKFIQERIEQQDSVIYVAEEDGKLLGFTQLYPLFSSTRMQRSWLLNDLYVAQDQRGRGISKLLIEQSKALARATNAAGVSLETEKSNTVGNQLYPATDFELDTTHNYYFWANDK